MDVDEAEETIGRLMSAIVEFDEAYERIDLSSHITGGQYELFHMLANTYEGRLKKAKSEVEQSKKKAYKGLRPKEYNSVDFNVYHCYECDHDTMIPNKESSTGYRCTFCGNEESADIEINCDKCGCPSPKGMMLTSYTEDGFPISICPHCSNPEE
jgi:hypothetical protein